MARYRFKAVSADGQVGEGMMEAASHAEVITRLQSSGSIPIRAMEAASHWADSLRAPTRGRSLKGEALAGVISQLGALLRAGLPLDRALEILRDVSTRNSEAELATALLETVVGGGSLGDAMAARPQFSRFCVSMTRAGEASGTLDAALTRLAGFMTQAEAAKAKLQTALLYPVLVMVACAASLAVLFGFVVPRFRPFFASAQSHIPPTTRILLSVGDVVAAYWLPAVLAVILAALAAMALLRDPSRRQDWDRFVLRLPVMGELILKTEIGQWGEVLGTLLKNGVALQGALAIAGETIRNRAISAEAVVVARAVVEGKGLAGPISRAKCFPPLAQRLVRVGEEAARLDDMLLELGAIYARETERQRERLVTLIGPALTIGMGLIVALVMGSIVTAILGVYRLAI